MHGQYHNLTAPSQHVTRVASMADALSVSPNGRRWAIQWRVGGRLQQTSTTKMAKNRFEEAEEQRSLMASLEEDRAGWTSEGDIEDVRSAINKWRQAVNPEVTDAKRRRLETMVAPHNPSKVHNVRVTEGVTGEKELFRAKGFHAAAPLPREHTETLLELTLAGFDKGGAHYVHENRSAHMITICNTTPEEANKLKSKDTKVINLGGRGAVRGGGAKMEEYRLALKGLFDHIEKEADYPIKLKFAQALRFRDGKGDQRLHQDGITMACGALINLTDAFSTEYLDYDQKQWTSLPRVKQMSLMKEYWEKANSDNPPVRSRGWVKAGAVTIHDTSHIHRAPLLDKNRYVLFVAFETAKKNTSDSTIFNFEDWERALEATA
jgi:hypothetical protein